MTQQNNYFTRSTPISEVVSDPAFGEFGRLLLPANSGYWSGDTLGNLRLTWYTGIDPDKTVEIVNTLRDRANAGETIFYDIYTDAEKQADPAKRDTGLFFFRGEPGAKFAVCNAGELRCYTARTDIPQAAAVVMQYTSHSESSRADAPTYACCGTGDGIASWRTMQSRLQTLDSYGIPTEFHAYEGLPHGFGLGTGTVAESWINDAVAFWEANSPTAMTRPIPRRAMTLFISCTPGAVPRANTSVWPT